MAKDIKSAAKILLEGGIGVIPTDTVYGIVGTALKQGAVERIYEVRKRSSDKPFIILIGSLIDLQLFSIKPDRATRKILERVWPGKVSVILPCPSKKFFYLHRGKKSIAFRLPRDKKLLDLLEITGPLVAPSANPEGFPPADTIQMAHGYFPGKVDFYLDGGRITSDPSTLIRVGDGKIIVLREGEVKLDFLPRSV